MRARAPLAPAPHAGPIRCFHSRGFRMIRLVASVAVLIAGLALGGCSGGLSGGMAGDIMPQWAGGYPKDMPPRPGTPEYEAFKQKLDAEAKRDKSKDPPKPKADNPLQP
jgi:hypothetical protein